MFESESFPTTHDDQSSVHAQMNYGLRVPLAGPATSVQHIVSISELSLLVLLNCIFRR